MKNFKKYMMNFMKFRELLKELVIRDIKLKYRRSVLGMLWSLLQPLLMMIVLTIVFSNLFKRDIPNFPVYLLTGKLIFDFFSQATKASMRSITGNSSLIKKVYVPKYIFTLSKVLSTFITFIFSLIVLLFVVIITKVRVTSAIGFSVFLLIYLLIFVIGLSLILASISVYFRDITHLYDVCIVAWMYLTPLFYPIEIIPEKYKLLININPLYHFISYFRECILYGTVPSLSKNIICVGISVITLIIGMIIFKKKQDNFILYM